ncbi:MAG: isoprenylcysteine carboxylmethyltransferase family protein [Acidobacteriota bacterium]|nr:isoprenylcysteine carboxylmethyltransferase family protein [Acidobacteriota bacterium]
MEISRYQRRFGIGPIGLIIGLLLFGFLWMLDRSLGFVEIRSSPELLRVVGSLLIIVWICWHLWCMIAIRKWWVHGRLCTTGPFGLVRHPMYAGGLLLATPGFALMFNSWIMLLLPVLLYVAFWFLVRNEEAMMADVFGEEYRGYAARTGRFFPRILP